MTKKVHIPKLGAAKSNLKANWFRCHTCGKKSKDVIRLKNLPFVICPKCGAVTLSMDLVKRVIRKKDAPKIISPGQSGLIILPRGK